MKKDQCIFWDLGDLGKNNLTYKSLAQEQARNNFRFLGDWAPAETSIHRYVRRTSTAPAWRPLSPSRLESSLGWFWKPEVILGL